MTFSLSEAEHLKLRALAEWMKSKGSMDDNRGYRDELHSWLSYVLFRFERGIEDGSLQYMSAADLLRSQLTESLHLEAAE